MGFVVAIKPSARRANGAVGRLVHREGGHHAFADRTAAEAWAAGLSEGGDRPVWIRAAHPADTSDVDAYLVSRRADLLALDGAADKRRRRLRDEPGEQDALSGVDG